jgi:hypothetical protein
VGDTVARGEVIARAGKSGTWTPSADCAILHFVAFPSVEYEPWRDLPISFRNAGGPLDDRGGLIRGVTCTALPY